MGKVKSNKPNLWSKEEEKRRIKKELFTAWLGARDSYFCEEGNQS